MQGVAGSTRGPFLLVQGNFARDAIVGDRLTQTHPASPGDPSLLDLSIVPLHALKYLSDL